MRADMDKIVSLSDGDSTEELQKYLSSLTDDQVAILTQFSAKREPSLAHYVSNSKVENSVVWYWPLSEIPRA